MTIITHSNINILPSVSKIRINSKDIQMAHQQVATKAVAAQLILKGNTIEAYI